MKLLHVIIIVFVIFCCIPHYDKNCNFALVGQFYSKETSETFKNLTTTMNTDNISLSQQITSLQQENQQLKQTIQNIFSKHTTCLQDLENANQIKETLQFKIEQQHQFQENEKKIKQKEKKHKKEGFSKVSKKLINTKRPEIGNLYSKSLKKSSK